MAAREGVLLASSKVAANTGHSLHKGTPREIFIREFLESHLAETVAIGTGEVIDSESMPNPPPTRQRNQYDIIIYKKNYPKLAIGGGISAFLCESVVATIEVKSTLTKDELQSSARAARAAKLLKPSRVEAFRTGYHPPSILNYVVAYDGPASMKTVAGWLQDADAYAGVPGHPDLSGADRTQKASPSLDGVFVMGKGFMLYGNSPLSILSVDDRKRASNLKWEFADCEVGSLFLLFVTLSQVVSGHSATWLDAGPYLSGFSVQNDSIGMVGW